MDEALTARLSVLEDENSALAEANGKKREKVEELRNFHLEYNALYPKSAAALGEASDLPDLLDAPKVRLADAKQAILDAADEIDAIREARAIIRAGLPKIRTLDNKKLFDQALVAIDELSGQLADERFKDLAFLALTKEALAYDYCAVLTHKGEANIANGALPLERDELAKFLEVAKSLTTLMSPNTLKEAYIDEANGLTYVYCYRSVDTVTPTLETFRALEEALIFMEGNGEKASRLTQSRAKKLHDTYAKVFNRLSYEYFENEPNYDKAVEVFAGRDHLTEAEIEHYAYKSCIEERDFYFAFAKASALKKDPTAFKDWVLVHGQKAATGDEQSFMVLAHIVSMPLLDAAKFNIALRSTISFSFEQMICFLEACVRLGIDPEKARLVFDEVVNKRKEGDLTKMASALNYLNFHIDASLREPFNKLRLSLLRSNKAHQVKIKSDDENVHLVFGEEKDSYPVPAGKPLKSNVIKAWPMAKLVFYWILMLVLPIAVAAGAWFAMSSVLHLGEDNFTLTLVYAAPIMLVTVFLMLIGVNWCTRDEWESARVRRALLCLAILEGVAALLYFALPGTLSFLKPVAMPLFAASLLTGVLSMIVFHERKRGFRYLTLIPFILVEIGACVFLVLGGINGTIVF